MMPEGLYETDVLTRADKQAALLHSFDAPPNCSREPVRGCGVAVVTVADERARPFPTICPLGLDTLVDRRNDVAALLALMSNAAPE